MYVNRPENAHRTIQHKLEFGPPRLRSTTLTVAGTGAGGEIALSQFTVEQFGDSCLLAG